METVNLEQGTQAWYDARLGCSTASRIHEILSKPRKKTEVESAGRKNYKAQLVCEILSGKLSNEDQIETWWMKRAKELEPDARNEYEIRHGVIVDQCGFVTHPSIPRYGCSPDGLVGDEGLIQIKCLTRANHIDCLTNGIPIEFAEQMTSELSVCCLGSAVGLRLWNDFVSYHPEFPDHLKLYVSRIWRKNVLHIIEQMESEVRKFNTEVDETIRHLPKKESLEEQLTASIAAARQQAPA